ncbi:MAG: PEP/pyruvate-binding domain-containing protein, partial [Thermodesulfobacteriota bacterium]
SITALTRLTGGRHTELWPIKERLDQRLAAILQGREDRLGPPVLSLAEVGLADVGLVGGKSAHLGAMLRQGGLPVPPGFVITTRAFQELVTENGLGLILTRFQELLATPGAAATELVSLGQALATEMAGCRPPPGLLDALARQLASQPELAGAALAVRSSAIEEDMDFSFAGQFCTVLNVVAEPAAIFAAYRQVAASLFAPGAISYRRHLFPGEGTLDLAVCCQQLVPARSSGVLFTRDTATPDQEVMVVVGAWGQGEAVVEGALPTDTFRLAKGEAPQVLAQRIARKVSGRFPAAGGGLEERPLDPDLASAPCLSPDELLRLARIAGQIEMLFRRPQDIEWAVTEEGNIFILQARPLFVPQRAAVREPLAEALAGLPLLADRQGRIASHGVGAGPVHRVRSDEDLATFPDGAVLVAFRSSARYAAVIPRAAAVVTEIGTPASHLATLCREMRAPCLVGLPGIMAQVADGEEITVDAEDNRIFRGRVQALLTLRMADGMDLHASREIRTLSRLTAAISQLSLVDPLLGGFRAEACRSLHDVLRFTHETAVQALIEMGKNERRLLAGNFARRLALPVPTGILVIDLGGGLAPEAPANDVPLAAVDSIPFAAILAGMLHPGVWHQTAMPVSMRDLMASMFNPAVDLANRQYTGHNVAIIGADYVNLCFRLGYHFNIIDALASEVDQNNHIYFRFLGGVTDLTKRSRRAAMIAQILKALDFRLETRGDLVIARLAHLPRQEMEHTLNILGRLVGFTRQLDVRMESDDRAAAYAEAFLAGDYGVVRD